MAVTSWISRLLGATPVAALLAVSVGQAQTTVTSPPQSVEEALHQLSDKAGVVFAGQVVAVLRSEGSEGDDAANGVVEIEFRVDQAIRGCTAGTPYVLREWAGLWTGGVQRYHVGDQRLMFLHDPGLSGLSSPMDGMDGVIPIRGSNSQPAADTSNTLQSQVADLRWLGAKVQHPVSYRGERVRPAFPIAAPIPFLVARPSVTTITPGIRNANVALSTTSAGAVTDISDASVPDQQAPVATVIGMLKSWQKAKRVVR
jgi:hypothetical protein